MAIIRRWTAPFFPLVAGSVLPVALVGCLAQQADLKRVEGTLKKEIADLDRRERALAQKMEVAQKQIVQQNKYAKQLFQVSRARSRQELRELRNEELVRLQGSLEEAGRRLSLCREDIDVLRRRLENLSQALVTAIPNLHMPSRPDPLSGIETSPQTPSDMPAGPQQAVPRHPELSDQH